MTQTAQSGTVAQYHLFSYIKCATCATCATMPERYVRK